ETNDVRTSQCVRQSLGTLPRNDLVVLRHEYECRSAHATSQTDGVVSVPEQQRRREYRVKLARQASQAVERRYQGQSVNVAPGCQVNGHRGAQASANEGDGCMLPCHEVVDCLRVAVERCFVRGTATASVPPVIDEIHCVLGEPVT